jgi:hypothetical protein
VACKNRRRAATLSLEVSPMIRSVGTFGTALVSELKTWPVFFQNSETESFTALPLILKLYTLEVQPRKYPHQIS